MINAWSLLWEELNGTMDETYPIKKEEGMSGIRTDGSEGKSKYWFDYDRNDPDKENPFIVGGGGTDTIRFVDDAYPTVSANFPSGNVFAADTVSFGTDFTGASEFGGVSNFWAGDGFSVTGNPTASSDTLNLGQTHLPGGMGEDHISFSGYAGTAYDDPKYYVNLTEDWEDAKKPKPDLKGSSPRKYQEDKSMKDLSDYDSSTYQGHYTNDNSDVQTLDLIHSVGDAESFCRSNALKYLSRYDKKGQAKRDILKAMHYCLLLYYFSGQTNDEITTRGYETF